MSLDSISKWAPNTADQLAILIDQLKLDKEPDLDAILAETLKANSDWWTTTLVEYFMILNSISQINVVKHHYCDNFLKG